MRHHKHFLLLWLAFRLALGAIASSGGIYAQGASLTIDQLVYPVPPTGSASDTSTSSTLTSKVLIYDEEGDSSSVSVNVSITKIKPNDNPPACVATPFEMPGQVVWTAGLTTGGIVAGQYSSPMVPDFYKIFDVQAKNGNALNKIFSGTNKSIIFVMDVFNPVYVQAGESSIKLSHGELVMSHITNVILSAGFKLQRKTNGDLVFKYGNDEITVRKIALKSEGGQYYTRDIPKSFDPPSGYQGILNMSFAVIPCEPFRLYKNMAAYWAKEPRKKLYSLNDFLSDVTRLTSMDGRSVSKDEVALLFTRPPTDSFYNWISSNAGKKLIAVASSGNYGLNVPMWPASAPNVIGVSGTTQDGINPAPWSNTGDVRSTGEWFYSNSPKLSYRGTSFSAPSVTAFLALRMLNGECFKLNDSRYPTGFIPLGSKIGASSLFRAPLATQPCH